jgi:hypothetical protein
MMMMIMMKRRRMIIIVTHIIIPLLMFFTVMKDEYLCVVHTDISTILLEDLRLKEKSALF